MSLLANAEREQDEYERTINTEAWKQAGLVVDAMNTMFTNLPGDQLETVVTVLTAMVPIGGAMSAEHRGDLAALLRFARNSMKAPGGRHLIRRMVGVILQYSAENPPKGK